jgi:hypothetical protein
LQLYAIGYGLIAIGAFPYYLQYALGKLKLHIVGSVLIIHTVICGNIPMDSNWFYIDPPVHAAFHTNKSMSILMEQWGYKASVYCLSAKSWVLFKEPKGVKEKVCNINKELQTQYLVYKDGFVDYWK